MQFKVAKLRILDEVRKSVGQLNLFIYVMFILGMFTCPSYRLLDRAWTYYKERRKPKQMLLGDKLQMWYTITLNPEPIMLQVKK